MFIAFLAISSCKRTTINIDNGFPDGGKDSVSITVDTSTGRIDASKFSAARVFPGLICAEEPRITKTVSMNLDYNPVGSYLRISVPPYPQFSTGFYAAPGELVTIDVPANMYSLAVQIGAWTDNLSTKQGQGIAILRDPLIYSRQQLAPGRNYVRNLYGGHIFIIGNVPIKDPVTLTFGNVCKSPDFVLGETNAADWLAAIKTSCVPHLELRSKNFSIIVPREYCLQYPVSDPVEMLTEWDRGMNEDYYKWTGLTDDPNADPLDKKPQLPIRFVLDIDLSVGYGHNGSPIVGKMDQYWFTSFTDLTNMRNAKVWGTYHEIGHNFQQGGWWSWSTLGETTNNLFIFKLAHRLVQEGYTGAWPPKEHLGIGDQTAATAIGFAADPAGGKNFDGTDTRINNPFLRLIPFLQIFDKVPANWDGNGMPDGWGFFPYLYSQARKAVRQPATDLAKHDFVFENLCDYTKKNWIVFFKKWGIQVSDVTLNRVFTKGYAIMNKDFWNYNPTTQTGGNNTFNSDPYDKANWAISSFSTQQNGGEGNSCLTGVANSNAVRIIDKDKSSYWHSNWSGTAANPPHWIIVDFNNILTPDNSISIAGFVFVQRIKTVSASSTARNIKNMRVEISMNGTTWTQVTGSPFLLAEPTVFGTCAVPPDLTFMLPSPVNARYVRLWVNANSDTWENNNFAALAEFDVVKP
jgi:hypothetical protein